MKVIKIIVDKIPNGCHECLLNICQEPHYPIYICAGLKTNEYDAEIQFGMNDYRRHDCPLESI